MKSSQCISAFGKSRIRLEYTMYGTVPAGQLCPTMVPFTVIGVLTPGLVTMEVSWTLPVTK